MVGLYQHKISRLNTQTVLACLFCCWISPGSTAFASQCVYLVREQEAIDTSHEGQQARQEMHRLFRRLQRELNSKAKELSAQREIVDNTSTSSLRQQLVQREKKLYQNFLSAKQDLQQQEQKRVAKLQTKLSKLISQIAQRWNDSTIISDQHYRFLTLNPACDRTRWFAQAMDNKQPPFQKSSACCMSLFALIDIQTLLDKSSQSQKVLKKLDHLYRLKQKELDRRKERIRQIQRAGKMARAHRNLSQLENQYKTYKRELDQEHTQRLDKLLQKLAIRLNRVTTPTHKILFLSKATESHFHRRLQPACEVTRWAIRLLDTGATPFKLAKICPTIRR